MFLLKRRLSLISLFPCHSRGKRGERQLHFEIYLFEFSDRRSPVTGRRSPASTWKQLNTRTSSLLCGMLGVRTGFDLYGGIISRTHKASSLWLTAMTETVLLRQGMSFMGCYMRMN
ncbi:hypothetical protein AABB24_019686 [Solanum stoloniferum]|uniref:Uncharacterized protein n=1 Tax=Solanum stoloniferum TaxID=62892 RepID=A0ABD2T4R7_9SOLN